MAVIPNFPENLLNLHHNWHVPGAVPGPGARVHAFGTTGGGLEFLQFHHDFIGQFHAWYDSLPFGTAPYSVAPFVTAASAQAAVAGWTSIPAPLKNGMVTGWGGAQIGQEARLTTLTPPFTSDDDLGYYIEGGIHAWIHGAAAAAYNEPEVKFFHSPLSTYFYGIHGLVDYWWRHWKNAQQKLGIIETKSRVFIKEHKELFKEQKKLITHLVKNLEKPGKEIEGKAKEHKDIFDGGGLPGGGGDPLTAAVIADPQQRP